MKAAVVERPRIIVVKDVPKPMCDDYSIIVKVCKAAICNHSDVALWEGKWPPVKDFWEPSDYPFILGHEFSGEIVEIGAKVKEIYPELKLGDRICEWTWCGGFAEYVRIDVRKVCIAKLPENISYEEGALLELAGGSTMVCAYDCFRPAYRVLIMGCGPAGLCLIQHAKNLRAEVAATDLYDSRLKLARKLGASAVYNASEYGPAELAEVIKRDFGEVDVVVDTAGAKSAVTTGIEALRYRGEYIIFAHPTGGVPVPFKRISEKKIIIRSFDASRERRIKLLALAAKQVSEGKLDLKSLISHRLPLAKVEEGLKLCKDKPSEVVKIVIDISKE